MIHDPSRIPEVIDALERAWLGRPDFTFQELLRTIELHGLNDASTTQDVLAICEQLSVEAPHSLSGQPTGYVVETQSPNRAFIFYGDRIIACGEYPTTWQYSMIQRAEMMHRLAVIGQGGAMHRYGVVSAIRRITDATHKVFVLSEGLASMRLHDGRTHVFLPQRRSTRVWVGAATLAEDVLTCELGDLVVEGEFASDIPLQWTPA